MKRLFATLGVLSLSAVLLFAGGMTSVKQKARDLANKPRQNPPSQPAPAPTHPQPATTTQPRRVVVRAGSAKPKEEAVPEEFVARLVADLGAIKPGTAATSVQKDQLKKTLSSASKAGKAPSSEDITRLANLLADAWPSQKISSSDLPYFARDVQVILNANNRPAAELNASFKTSQQILKYSGMGKRDIDKINKHLKSIAEDLKR